MEFRSVLFQSDPDYPLILINSEERCRRPSFASFPDCWMRGCRQALQFLCHACGEFSPSCPALESHSDEFAVLQRMEELLEKLRYFAGDHAMGPSERPTVRQAVRVSLGFAATSPGRRAQTRPTK